MSDWLSSALGGAPSRRAALALMLIAPLLWSIAGVVSRQIAQAQGFEMTFWRSLCNAVALLLLFALWRGPKALWRAMRNAGPALWVSGLCWAVMFTAFMMALTLTTVANVLVTMALGPLFTALLARVALGHRLGARTWFAIALAGVGIVWMYGDQVAGTEPKHLWGTLVGLAVPVAGAVNWNLLQHLSGKAKRSGLAQPEMLSAVLIGALISAAVCLPLALPFRATGGDVAWLGLLGVAQLAIPCLMSVVAARTLSGPELSLLSLLEVLLGVLWAWLGAGERPTTAVWGGGTLVLGALALNELWSLKAGPTSSK